MLFHLTFLNAITCSIYGRNGFYWWRSWWLQKPKGSLPVCSLECFPALIIIMTWICFQIQLFYTFSISVLPTDCQHNSSTEETLSQVTDTCVFAACFRCGCRPGWFSYSPPTPFHRYAILPKSTVILLHILYPKTHPSPLGFIFQTAPLTCMTLHSQRAPPCLHVILLFS